MQLKWPMLWDLFSLFPAHAGVIHAGTILPVAWNTFPRTRGGDPPLGGYAKGDVFFSPHTRG